MSIVQKKEDALVLGFDRHLFQPASIGEYHFMLLGETCFWTLLYKQELAEKGIEEYGRFLKTSEIFEANPWEATECSGDASGCAGLLVLSILMTTLHTCRAMMGNCPSQPVARILLRIPLRSEGA